MRPWKWRKLTNWWRIYFVWINRLAFAIEDEHTLLFTCGMNVSEVKNFKIKNFKNVLNNSRFWLWTVIPIVNSYRYLIWMRNILSLDFHQFDSYLRFLAKWSRDISRDLLTQSGARACTPLWLNRRKRETSRRKLKKKRGGNPHSSLKEELSHRKRRHHYKPHIDVQNVERAIH